MSSRRDFIRQGLIAATAMGTLTAFDAKGLTIAAKGSVKKYPIVISTWDFGIAANKAAWEILSKGGKALDAVEQGVRVPEADLKNMT
ncbi:MAG: glycosylasparaginase, partial [Sphingobacterium siyangense]